MEQNSKSKTLICVLLLIPLVVIVYFAVIYSSNNIDPSDIASVTLEFSDGRKTELTDTDEFRFMSTPSWTQRRYRRRSEP